MSARAPTGAGCSPEHSGADTRCASSRQQRGRLHSGRPEHFWRGSPRQRCGGIAARYKHGEAVPRSGDIKSELARPAGLLAFAGGTTQHGSDDKEVAHGSAADVDNFFVQSGSAGGGRLTEPAQTLPTGYHLRTSTTPMRSCTLRAGTRKVRGFATGQGRGWPWSKTPSCRRLRPGGAYGKRSYEALTEQLNITSRCITRSRQDLRARDALPYLTMFFRGTTVNARSYTMLRYVM